MSVISLDEWRKKQAAISKLKSPLPQNIPWDELGLTPTEVTDQLAAIVTLYVVLDRAWRRPFTVSSQFARQGAFYVAIAASEGMITTNCGEDTWGNRWLITEHGMETKGELDGLLQNILAKARGKHSPTH